MKTILAISIIVALGSCSRSEDPFWTIEHQDGVDIRRYHSVDPPRIDPCEPGEVTVFGHDQSADTYFLRYAVPLLVLPDGNLLISGGENESGLIHRFSSEGYYLSSFGRMGEGPGEIRTGAHVVFLLGDTIAVPDKANKRISHFDLSGRYLGLVTMPAEIAGHANPEIIPLSRSRFILVSLDGRGLSQTDAGTVFRWRYLIQELGRDLLPIDTAVDTLMDHVWKVVGNKYLFSPMGRTAPVSSVAAPGLPVAWIERDIYRVEFLDLTTRRRYAVELPYPQEPITAEIRRRFVDAHVDMDYSREGLNRLQLPAHLPAIDVLRWDDQGRLWVRDYVNEYAETEAETFYFNVFSREGEWLFRQQLDRTPDLIQGGALYFSDEDDEGNPLVIRQQLKESESR
ncbi:hypothetical protein ACFL6R_00325 [Gemmatimonadota bacterium]